MTAAIPRLHLVTPPQASNAVLDAIEEALGADAPLVQIRIKDVTDRDRLDHACAAVERIQHAGALAIVNDRVDVALATGADGVHLGADDLPLDTARALLGPDAIIGATCRSAADATRAATAGADYLGVGPVYPTTTKTGLPDPLGADGVGEVAAATELPVIAIAGITVDRVAALLAAGAHGVAVVGAVFAAADVATAVHDFRRALRESAVAAPLTSTGAEVTR